MWLFFGFLVVSSLLLVAVSLLNRPIIGFVILMRRRLGRATCAAVRATSFASVGAYLMWTAEWFDVYRHSMPRVGYFVRAMVAPKVLMAITGWTLGRVIGRGSLRRVPS